MKLHQFIAAEKDRKAAASRRFDNAYHTAQKSAAFNGFAKTYQPAIEDGARLPGEGQLVTASIDGTLATARQAMTDMLDLALTKDAANQKAVADIVVGTETLATDVPVSTLLWLEKKLVDVRTLFNALPVLDPQETWTWDAANARYVSGVVETARQVTVPDFHMAAPATDKHQAVVVEKQKTVVQGYWTAVKYSTAIPATEKQALLDRVEAFLAAVKIAREKANHIDVGDSAATTAAAVMSALFARN